MPIVPKRPGRLTITVPRTLLAAMQRRADEEGRSLSNLAAVLLEVGMDRLRPWPADDEQLSESSQGSPQSGAD
jgi:hypothetical protein